MYVILSMSLGAQAPTIGPATSILTVCTCQSVSSVVLCNHHLSVSHQSIIITAKRSRAFSGPVRQVTPGG